MAPAKPKAAKATHGRKDLKDAAGGLHAHSSSLAFFTSRWRALEDHLSFIHLSIEDRLRELESREQVLPAASRVATTLQPSQNDEPAAAGRAEAEPEVVPRPELRSLCVNMNAKDLLAFVNDNRGELPHIHKELVPALRAAPDPATLVLDALDEFYPFNRGRKGASDAGVLSNRRSCISLLERLRMISPEIEPAVRQRAKKLAAEWELAMMPDNVHYLEAIAFLHLLVTFDIASDFEEDDLLDLLVSIVKTREAVDLCRSLGLYKRMDDIIQKLSSKGKQLDAVKFVYAFDLVEKFPPVPLLRAYVSESKRTGQEMRKSGTTKSQKAAIAREIEQIRAVIGTIQKHKLESEYSPEILQKHITRLEQDKVQKRYSAVFQPSAGATKSKTQYQRRRQENKRPHPSTDTATVTASTAVGAPPLPFLSQTQPQFPLTVGRLNMASTGPYDLNGGIHLNNQSAAMYRGTVLDLGLMQSTLGSFLYSDPRSRSGLYDASGTYGSFPGGFPPQ